MGEPSSDLQSWKKFNSTLQEEFRKYTVAQMLRLLEEHDVPCGPVHNHTAMVNDPQVKHNKLLTESHDTRFGLNVLMPRPAAEFLSTPTSAEPRLQAPTRGQHSAEILRTMAGMSENEIL